MKKSVILVMCVFLAGAMVMAQGNKNKDELKFDKIMHDYGSMAYGADGTYHFKFKNTSDKPVVLTDVKSSCGCTVPSWSKEPIQPGETSSIKVVYNTKIAGTFNKTVTVYSTANNSPVRLIIHGEVNAQLSDIKAAKIQGLQSSKKVEVVDPEKAKLLEKEQAMEKNLDIYQNKLKNQKKVGVQKRTSSKTSKKTEVIKK